MDTEILDWIAQRPMVSWSMLNVTVVIIRDMNTTTTVGSRLSEQLGTIKISTLYG